MGALQKSTAAPWRAVQPHGRAPGIHGRSMARGPAPRARSRNPRPLHGAQASPTGALHGIHGRSMARDPAPRARSRNPRPLHGARSSPTGALQESTAAPWRPGQPYRRAPEIHGRSMARGPAPWARSRNPRPLHGSRSSPFAAASAASGASGGGASENRRRLGGAFRNRRRLGGGSRSGRRFRRRLPKTAAPWCTVQPHGRAPEIHGRSMAPRPAP